MPKRKKPIVIETYPHCPKPDWMKVGAWCYCLGEAFDVFTVDMVLDKAAVLSTASGYAHGIESFTKLYQSQDELEKRRNEKSPLEWSSEEMSQYVASVRESVQLFLKRGNSSFSDLVQYISSEKFRVVDEEMFEEWTKKEFPGQFSYIHVQEGTLGSDDLEE